MSERRRNQQGWRPCIRHPGVIRFLAPLLVGLSVAAAAVGQLRADDAVSAMEKRLGEAVRYLASDELEGRGVETAGINVAAEFIADQLNQMGLYTSVFEGTPFQPFTVPTRAELGPREKNHLLLVGPPLADKTEPQRLELELGEDFNTLAIGGSGEVEAPVVFVGYGITAKQHQYDDYAGIDVKDKVVLMLRKEPEQDDSDSVFDGKRPSRHALFGTKVANAYEHGAAAVILVNDEFGVQAAVESAKKQWAETLDRLVQLRDDYLKLQNPDPDAFAQHRGEVLKWSERLQKLDRQVRGESDELLGLDGAGRESSHRQLPVFFARRFLVDEAIQGAIGIDLAALEAKIDEGPSPHSRELKGWKAICRAHVIHRKAEVKNVAAVLEGVGALADETVIVGAHYDHLGLGGPGSLAPWTEAIHNGADDNASGSAALLEVARSMASRAEAASRRRVVFLAFAAEEKGLLGSVHYAREPAFPLEQTVAMVNMDMVGRLNNNKLIVHGTGTAKMLDELIDQLNQKYSFEITKKPSGYGPSDHATFYAKKIPVLHFFTGTHRDYHRPSDDFEKINVTGMGRIAQMVTDVVDALATAETRPHYLATRRNMTNRGGDRPYFGSIPEFGREVEGYPLMGVSEGSPADLAGIKAEDVIIQLGESKIGGLEDFDGALRKYRVGDTVQVVVRRGDETLELSVTLDRTK